MLTAPWRIEMFGGLRARQSDQCIERFRRGSAAALLACLGFLKQRHARAQLAARVWPEAAPAAGRATGLIRLHGPHTCKMQSDFVRVSFCPATWTSGSNPSADAWTCCSRMPSTRWRRFWVRPGIRCVPPISRSGR